MRSNPWLSAPALVAAIAAPTMPASLPNAAGTISARLHQQRPEMLPVLGDAAADDEHVRPQQRVIGLEHRVDLGGPLDPVELAVGAHLGRGAMLGLLAAHLEVAEFGVRQQPAVDEQRRADAGAQRDDHDRAGAVAARAQRHLGEAGGVGVVQERDRALQPRLQVGLHVHADPALVDVGGGPGHALLGDGRKREPDRAGRRQVARHRHQQFEHGLGRGARRRGAPQRLAHDHAGLDVHEPGLDERAAHVEREPQDGSPSITSISSAVSRSRRERVPSLLLPGKVQPFFRLSIICWFAASAICASRSRIFCWRDIATPAIEHADRDDRRPGSSPAR